MNSDDQKTARKIGEVLAFSISGLETLHKGQKVLIPVLGDGLFNKIESNLVNQQKEIRQQIKAKDFEQVVEDKAIATTEKLKQMQDFYLQEQWDDSTEILEWLGFFEGAAIVHCSLVEKKTINNQFSNLNNIIREAKLFHQDFLQKISDLID